MFNQSTRLRQTPSIQAGFGLVELMVSIGIVVLVMGIVIARHDSFNGAVLLRSQAYEVALQIREVQLSAVSVIGNSGEFRDVLGVHFSTVSNQNQAYRNFRDGNPNNYYYESNEQEGKLNNLDRRFTISAIRLIDSSGGTISSPTNLSILFERPNFDARFYTAANTPASTASAVEIDISLAGEVRTVEISKTGQIIVQDN